MLLLMEWGVLSLKKVNIYRLGFIPVVTVILGLVFLAVEPRFGSISNLKNIIFQAGILALLAFGQFFPVLSGGLDFSSSAIMALSSIVGALIMTKIGLVAGIVMALFTCGLVGVINGVIIAKFRVSPMIVTLGMSWIISGITLMLSNGQVIFGVPKTFQLFGVSRVVGLPVSAIWGLLAFLICFFILHSTVYGRHLYALGANDRTARLSGINIDVQRAKAYVICSLLVAFAGLVLTAALGSGQPSLGADLGMQSFVAVFIAGVRWGGGEGSIVEVALGVIFVTVLSNGLNVLNVSSYVQMVITGAILVFALTVDMVKQRRLSSKGFLWGRKWSYVYGRQKVT